MEWMPGGVVDLGGKGVGARGRRRESPGFFIPTEPARSGTGLPFWFGRELAGNRMNSNLNSNHAVQSGPTGIPIGLTGIPDRFEFV
jgi:hypothetical protein